MANHPLKILFWNDNGIEHKINELHNLTTKYSIDIILLNENRFYLV